MKNLSLCLIGGLALGSAIGLAENWYHRSQKPAVAIVRPLDAAASSVVEIRTFTTNEQGQTEEEGTGSGIAVTHDGYVLTCLHVVKDAGQIVVQIGDIRTEALVMARDEELDLALLLIDRELPTIATWADSQKLQSGDAVYAIGFPYDMAKFVRRGIIASPHFVFPGEYSPFIVTDAPVNPGDSGGGLFNLKGELLGIPARIQCVQGLRANIGIAYAIPGNLAHWFGIVNTEEKEADACSTP